MTDVFFSYAREDFAVIRELVSEFERHELQVFFDRDIPVGKDFPDVIEQNLNAASCVVVVWSRASVNSRWVRSEAEAGAERGLLVPIRIEDVKVPLQFRSIETADLIGWPDRSDVMGVRKTIQAIQKLVGRQDPNVEAESAHIDPTLSQRVAKRVLDGLRHGKQTLAKDRQVDLERAFAVCLLAMLRNEQAKTVLASLLSAACEALSARCAQLKLAEFSLVVGSEQPADFTDLDDQFIEEDGSVQLKQTDETLWQLRISSPSRDYVVFVGVEKKPNSDLVESAGFFSDILEMLKESGALALSS